MGHEKAINSGKERRNHYRKSKSFDSTCRNHGSCDYCKGDRTHKNEVRKRSADEQVEDGTIPPPDEWPRHQ